MRYIRKLSLQNVKKLEKCIFINETYMTYYTSMPLFFHISPFSCKHLVSRDMNFCISLSRGPATIFLDHSHTDPLRQRCSFNGGKEKVTWCQIGTIGRMVQNIPTKTQQFVEETDCFACSVGKIIVQLAGYFLYQPPSPCDLNRPTKLFDGIYRHLWINLEKQFWGGC